MVIVVAGAAVLSACSSSSLLGGDGPKAPDCPTVNVLSDANRLTVYRPGPGRDLSDIAYEVRLIGFDGDCSYTAANKQQQKDGKYTDVAVNLRPRFRVVPGPALAATRVTLDYFVAMPDFYPNPEGRADFTRTTEIPANRTPVEITDADIQVNIPLSDTRRGPGTAVYIGLVLSEEQLEQNRRRSGGRLEP